jgi:hypothetical protein
LLCAIEFGRIFTTTASHLSEIAKYAYGKEEIAQLGSHVWAPHGALHALGRNVDQ